MPTDALERLKSIISDVQSQIKQKFTLTCPHCGGTLQLLPGQQQKTASAKVGRSHKAGKAAAKPKAAQKSFAPKKRTPTKSPLVRLAVQYASKVGKGRVGD